MPMDRLGYHPLADLFPLMSDEEVNDLGEDMLIHGQRKRIMLFEGMILDGRNRYNACLLKGIEPRFVDYHGPDPLGLVISLNLKRRHLDDAQRAIIAAKLATMKRGDNQHSPNGETSQAKAAELLNVSKRRVERAREVIEKGVLDLVDAVEQGEVKVSAAAEFANKVPPLDQARLIAQHGSPAAAVNATRQNDVKARADRAAFKTPKPVPDVTPAADRAEAKSKLAVVPGEPGVKGAPSDNPATLLGVLAWFERTRAPIDLESAIAGMSGSDRITLDTQIMRAQAWFGQIAMIKAGATRAKGVGS
jgi:hypothetical protein